MSGRVVNVLISGAKNQAQILKSFATTPTGPFKTVDRMIESGRSTAKRAIGSTGAGVKGLSGQKFLGRGKAFARNFRGARSLPMVKKARSRMRIR